MGRKLAAVPAVPPEEIFSVNTIEELQRVDQIMAERLGERMEQS